MAEQKRTECGPRLPQESSVIFLEDLGSLRSVPTLLVHAILLPSRVSLISAVCLCDAQSHLPGKNTVLVSMRPEEAFFSSKVAVEEVTLEDCCLE